MNTIEKLKSIKVLDELINAKLVEIDRLRILATKVNVTNEGERVQTSSSGDKVSECVVKIVDLQHEINADIDRFVDLKRECMSIIDAIDDQLLVGILYRRYFEYKTWERIAEELYISRQWATEKHKQFVDSCL